MSLSRVERAVLNNTRWYEAMFAAHGLPSVTDERVWRSLAIPPPFHSNLVVLSPKTIRADIEAYAAQIEAQPRPTGWSLKDSYACLDLAALDFSVLFDAHWIWRDPVPADAAPLNSRLSWTRLATPASLAEWEQAWSGDTRNETEGLQVRQFPDRLLGSPDHAFFAGRLDGKVVAGGIANRSPGAVGLSNLFAPPEFADETWRALATSISLAFPGVPIVGYERGADLNIAASAGFVPIGKLRVWCRPA
jgi:hypothetical protein